MYKVRIEKLDHFGRGIARINDKIVFIPNTLKNDLVEIEIVKDNKKYLEGTVINYIEKSPRKNICPYSNLCGGCHIIDMEYKEQLMYKVQKVKELFKKTFKKELTIKDIISDCDTNYRNKITLHVKNKKLGFYKEESNELVEIDYCIIAKEEINNLIEPLKELVKHNDIDNIIIRSNQGILLDIKGGIAKETLLNTFNNIDVIYLNNKLIKGEGVIYEEVLNNQFKISPKSFFQVNTRVCSKIFEKVRNYIKDKNYKIVLDLYCGTGVIGIVISSLVDEVIGIEVVNDAVKNAFDNKKLNEVNNIDFICDKVENRINEFKDIDLIIVDPPRSGLNKKSIDSILKISPKDLIYISCDPATLMRDLNLLSKDYEILEFSIADMFPNTYHVECVCSLSLK